ncbi:hypothetical protein [Poseidonibacter ostreae]|uniref:Uncharacterized protein n=1 Tax=Poseidonibacter ostreae TaxID=2654171 RepID=A0A6L4WNM4_9BACT|nr:hypothetical protein [Poseidonibacter ostreae]KAB7883031.1 hypothetical protein GA417_13335 [Poseidonibacter ostreae]KAB7884918.1 hypothetical protein GBG19_15130 [Poseidonibacter ostreae]KAB7887400.1 hypothetical protein GBG18_14025 [Poseidonibacter ostreae]
MNNIESIDNLNNHILENMINNNKDENKIKFFMKINSQDFNEQFIVVKEIINKFKVKQGDEISIYGLCKRDVKVFRNNNSLILLANNGKSIVSFDEFYSSISENYMKNILSYSSVQNKDDVLIVKVP